MTSRRPVKRALAALFVLLVVGGVAVAGESSVLPYTGDKTTLSNLAVPFLSATNLNTATVPAGTTSTSASPYFQRIVDVPTTLGISSEEKKRKAS